MTHVRSISGVNKSGSSKPGVAERGATEAEQADDLRARLAAAERRIAELDSVNQALRSGTERIVCANSVDTILESFLTEAVRMTDSPCGAIADHIQDTEFSIRSLTGCHPEELEKCSLLRQFRANSREDPGGLMSRLVSGESFSVGVDEIEQWYPELGRYHRMRGHRSLWHFPIAAGTEIAGFLALAFNESCSFCEWKNSTVQVLGQQASVALNVVRLAETAKRCAIATERARVAQGLATELSRMNAAISKATDQLATQTEIGSFYGQLVQESADLLQAQHAHLTVIDEGSGVIRKLAYLKLGVLSVPDSAIETPLADASAALERLGNLNGVHYFDPDEDEEIFWPGALAFYRSSGYQTVVAIPLMRSAHCMGFMVLAFQERRKLTLQEQELLHALAQHATLAMHLTRLADQVQRGAVLEERVALARDLHDTLLQGFTGVALQLRALLRKPQHDWAELRSILEGIEQEATRAVREARIAVGDIRGVEPGTSDLVTALQELVHSERARTSAHLCWRLEGEQIDIPRPVAESLFLVGREALTNAIRHAHASSIEVSLAISARTVQLKIQDNGQGFAISPETARQQGHWGLVGIGERTERLGGRCRMESRVGQGTTISVEISL